MTSFVPGVGQAPVPDVFDPRQYGVGVPYAAYRVLRDHHPVAWQEESEVLGWPAGPGFWAVTRHADVVLVTGVVTRNMAEPLRLTVAATPQQRVVMAVGDCARDCGMFRGAYGVVGAVGDVVPVDLSVAGCPPAPADIVAALRRVTGR